MNKDADLLSEEKLKLFELKSKYPTWDEISVLARIALAGQKENPEYFIVMRLYGTYQELDVFLAQSDAEKRVAEDKDGVIIPCYTTPQSAPLAWIEFVSNIADDTHQNESLRDWAKKLLAAAPEPERK